MVRTIVVFIGGVAGLILGAGAGFGVALAVAKPRYDGAFAMREMLVCVPAGALVGTILGIVTALKVSA